MTRDCVTLEVYGGIIQFPKVSTVNFARVTISRFEFERCASIKKKINSSQYEPYHLDGHFATYFLFR